MFKLFITFIIIILLILIIILIRSSYEIKNYVIDNQIIYDKKIHDRLSIIFISDLHEKIYGVNNDVLINDLLNNDYKYIVLGGDFIVNSSSDIKNNTISIDNTIKFIEKLSLENNKYKKKIYFSLGNHELRLKYNKNTLYDKLISSLENNGIELIDDNYVDFDKNVRLYSISIFKGFYKKSFIFNNKKNLLNNEIIKSHIGEIDISKFNIILSHSPDYADNLLNYGFDFVISGHYHGGLIRLPIIGTVFSPDLILFPKYSYGLYKNDNKYVYVSNGIGEHYIKIRFLNVPSFLKLDLLGE